MGQGPDGDAPGPGGLARAGLGRRLVCPQGHAGHGCNAGAVAGAARRRDAVPAAHRNGHRHRPAQRPPAHQLPHGGGGPRAGEDVLRRAGGGPLRAGTRRRRGDDLHRAGRPRHSPLGDGAVRGHRGHRLRARAGGHGHAAPAAPPRARERGPRGRAGGEQCPAARGDRPAAGGGGRAARAGRARPAHPAACPSSASLSPRFASSRAMASSAVSMVEAAQLARSASACARLSWSTRIWMRRQSRPPSS